MGNANDSQLRFVSNVPDSASSAIGQSSISPVNSELEVRRQKWNNVAESVIHNKLLAAQDRRNYSIVLKGNYTNNHWAVGTILTYKTVLTREKKKVITRCGRRGVKKPLENYRWAERELKKIQSFHDNMPKENPKVDDSILSKAEWKWNSGEVPEEAPPDIHIY
ncbi:hypothetical protein Pfo_000155 [Paulownia fortunei]|nr:hypothetical protein Pfo_000155 [Paulownia fortunei]